MQGVEIKLTALPDNTTCELSENFYGCEIVVRPDTIVYLACSIAEIYKQNLDNLKKLIFNNFENILDWTEPKYVIPHIPHMIDILDLIALSSLEVQTPLLMQPIWKTEGKSPRLVDNCLDIFIWSNLAFTRLFIDLAKSEINSFNGIREIKRHTRTVIWLFKMI